MTYTGRLEIGEVAQRLGVSVRAIRVYEAAGLIAPARTVAGRRSFGAADIVRLQQVLALKQTGCSLARIGALLAGRTLSPAQLVDAQIELLQARKAILDSTLATLVAVRARLQQGQTLDLAQFCDLIRTGDDTMTNAGWQAVFDRYYTPDDQARFRQAQAFFAPDQTDTRAAWTQLIARVEAAIAAGEPTDGTVALAIAQDWIALQQPLVDAVGAQTWRKTATMYQDMAAWQTEDRKAPFSAEVYGFVQAAADAGRAAGSIAARQPEPE